MNILSRIANRSFFPKACCFVAGWFPSMFPYSTAAARRGARLVGGPVWNIYVRTATLLVGGPPHRRRISMRCGFGSVADRPLIRCPATSAAVGDRNVALRCEVSARPPLTALFWIIDVNGTTVTEGQVVNEYWTLVMVGRRLLSHLAEIVCRFCCSRLCLQLQPG